MIDDSKVGTLEDEALKRKERLKALKRKNIETDAFSDGNNQKIELPKPKFRSYNPADERLKETVLPQAKPEDVESQVKDQLDAAKAKVVLDELDLTTLAPRKPDWDLKRDIAKKLEKLERRTQRAIAELIRERLKSGNLAEAVASARPED